jgi:membrane protein DedA with SNARE-associated domain
MEHFLASWGYVAIIAITAISSMGIPIGAEAAMGYGGALASGQLSTGHAPLNLVWVIVACVAGEMIGSYLGYAIGYLGGRPLVDRVGKYILLTHKDLDRAEHWFERRGEPVVLFGRLVPLLRSFVSFAAGLGEMRLVKFSAFSVIGSGVFCAALASIGYSLGSSWHRVVKDFSYAGYVAAVLVVLAVAALFWHRIRVVRAERASAVAAQRPASEVGPTA